MPSLNSVIRHHDNHEVSTAPECINPPDEEALRADERGHHVVRLLDGATKLVDVIGQ
jgi:hypothetical protein